MGSETEANHPNRVFRVPQGQSPAYSSGCLLVTMTIGFSRSKTKSKWGMLEQKDSESTTTNGKRGVSSQPMRASAYVLTTVIHCILHFPVGVKI